MSSSVVLLSASNRLSLRALLHHSASRTFQAEAVARDLPLSGEAGAHTARSNARACGSPVRPQAGRQTGCLNRAYRRKQRRQPLAVKRSWWTPRFAVSLMLCSSIPNFRKVQASLATLSLIVGGNVITADSLMARAKAECQGGTAAVSGSSEIATLAIHGTPITVTGQPNQTVLLPNGQVVINEQDSCKLQRVSGGTWPWEGRCKHLAQGFSIGEEDYAEIAG